MKNILKKIVTSVLLGAFVFSGVYQLVKLLPEKPNNNIDFIQTAVFINDFFDMDLDIAETANPNYAEEMIKFSVVQAIIVDYMSRSLTNQTRDTQMKTAIQSAVNNKRISIGSADDLYNFSMAVSYNWDNQASLTNYANLLTIEYLLGQRYALVADIDYSQMRSRKFNPIGIELYRSGFPVLDKPFQGEFDGQGFSITSLFVSDYSYITMKDSSEGGERDVRLIESYSMFASVGTSGVIKNLILNNPNYELLDSPEGLSKTSMFVGANAGLIYNVGVIDTKKDIQNNDISGIRFNMQFSQVGQTSYSAAGFVHTNKATGKIYNSYIVSKNILSTSSPVFRFDVRPFVYLNEGIISGAAYDKTVVPYVDSIVQPSGVSSYTSEQFKTGVMSSGGSAISINQTDLTNTAIIPSGEIKQWQYYALDGFPILFKLDYVSNAFEIHNEFDLIAFNKLINYNTPYQGVTYDSHNYRLMANIDMVNLPGYQTPKKEFKGIFSGGNSEFSNSPTINSNKYIYNLNINRSYILGTNYYMGMFSSVSGVVKNLNLYNNKITLPDTKDNYGKVINVGGVTGILTRSGTGAQLKIGTIRNVISDTDIDLGNEAIGQTNLGGIAGLAGGNISYTANLGSINGGIHNFKQTINGSFSIGGIVGKTNQTLTLTNSINKGLISSVGLEIDGTFNVASGTVIKNRVGGIIGEVVNLATTNHSLFYLTNEGVIKANNFQGKSGGLVVQNLGGIFGEVTGASLQISNGLTPLGFRNGRWTNSGDIESKYINTFTTVNGAGIGVSETSAVKAEFSYMTNSGNFAFDNLNYGNHNSYLFYASTILDNSTGGIKLSRAYNTASYTFDHNYFSANSGISKTKIEIAPFFVSKNTQDKELLFVENRGSLYIGSDVSISNVAQNLYVAGITLSNNVDYKNVSFLGSGASGITLSKINNSSSKEVFVSGITYALPYSTTQNRAYTMENVSNKADIVVTDFRGNSIITDGGGQASGAGTFSTTFTSSNLYVAGIVNLNVGELSNVFNFGDIIGDITGTANTFAGGITTFNYNYIQDAANSGLLNVTNTNASGIAYISSNANPASTSALFGGLIYGYRGGVVLGGISAALADTSATILEGLGRNVNLTAEVIDTANNGDIFGKANEYVRTGGIVGVALGLEITSGTENATNNSTIKRFSANETGSQDPISNSLVSNGLNFGNITAISKTIYVYSSEAQRPGIRAAAGGVIGYGLFKMKRMLNHGTISATDVAGGIVGATYIVGSTSSSSIPATIVDIDTAVHYGKVKAAKTTAYSSFNYDNSKDTSQLTYFYPDNSGFMFPITNPTQIVNKPGFGGIFGRLQRGTYGMMQSSNFINILNMDPNIDMVGRTDQSSVGSLIYYRFSLLDRGDFYYTARTNDTTPATLTGYNNSSATKYNLSSSSKVEYEIYRGRNDSTFTVRGIKITNGNGTIDIVDQRNVALFLAGGQSTYTYSEISQNIQKTETRTSSLSNFSSSNYLSTGATTQNNYETYGLTRAELRSAITSNNMTGYITKNNFTGTISLQDSTRPYSMEKVSDLKSTDVGYDASKTYIFNPSFPLMDAAQANFIYQAENNVLANRFSSPSSPNYKKNGMYVLASSKGREAGAVLPANVSLADFYGLKEPDTVVYYDLNNVSNSALNMPSQSNIGTDPLYMAYSSMFQIRKSDKSLVLPKVDQPTIGDIVFYNPNNQTTPVLEGGVIDNDNKTITFNVSSSAFVGNTFTYEVKNATLSDNAVIAVSNIGSANHSAFRNAYNDRTSNVMDGAFKFSKTGTFVNNRITLSMDVYSEIAADDVSLIGVYKTTYQIIINRVAGLNIGLTGVTVNGTAITPPSLTTSTSTYTIPAGSSLNPNGTITATFTDNGNLLPVGHEITVHGLYRNGLKVDEAYYSQILSGNVRNGANSRLGLSMTLSDELKSGLYQIEYSYYNSSAKFNLAFTKKVSTIKQITDVAYDTYSYDSFGNMTFIPTSVSFETFIEFAKVLDNVSLTSQNLGVTRNIKTNTDAYLNETESYSFNLGGSELLSIETSPFSTVNLASATVRYAYNSSGLKYYIFTYQVTSEAANDQTTITQTITERDLEAFIAYKDSNRAFNYPIEISREAVSTLVEVDFNLGENALYYNISTTIKRSGLVISPSINEVLINNNGLYTIEISNLLDKGLLTYDFTLTREGFDYNLGSLDILKKIGVDAYLRDINFQIGSGITVRYPIIYQTDTSGIIYDTRVYFEGIDYNLADENQVKSFRIDGEVTDINLVSYHPEFTLPIGAVIQRQVGLNEWSSDLSTNYISASDTELKIIKYRVLSEQTYEAFLGVYTDIADDSIIYYDITAVDRQYNLTLRFKIYYKFPNGTIVEAGASNSPIKDSATLINIKNYQTPEAFDLDVTIDPVTGEVIYPFEGEISSEIAINGKVLIKTQSTLFYYPIPININTYLYTFGQSKTGVYNFNVVTPKYQGVSSTDLTNGLRYNYSIYLTTNISGPNNPWFNDIYKLPEFDTSGSANKINGRYFYIKGNDNIQYLREFAIVIEPNTIGDQWGLYDDYTSWDEPKITP